MDVEEMGLEGMDWVDLAQDQVVDCCECCNELSVSIKCVEFLDCMTI
jgi:hypothetical protein